MIGNGQALDLREPSSAEVTLASTSGGTLTLDNAQHFTGQIAGFAGRDQIDVGDIGFGAHSTLGRSPNPAGTGGTLLVSDGFHIANLALLGQYMAGSFAAASDGHGGTIITEPPPS